MEEQRGSFVVVVVVLFVCFSLGLCFILVWFDFFF